MPQTYTDIGPLIPHRPPMVMIDRFTRESDTAGTAIKQFSASDYGCENGRVTPAVLIECVAQTVAAHHGCDRLDNPSGEPALGMLVAVDQFTFFWEVPGDESVTIKVERTDEIGPFHLIQGEVFCNGSLVARGKIKIFNQTGSGETA